MGATQSSQNKVSNETTRLFKSNTQKKDQKTLEYIRKQYYTTDRNDMNKLHRAAQIFNIDSFKQAEIDFKNYQNEKGEDFSTYVSKETIYGDSPLTFAIMKTPNHESEKDREILIDYLVKQCKVNTINKKTHWTPMHWAAMKGDIKTVKLLIEQECKAFIPSEYGFFPIDLAGYFRKYDIVKVIVDYSIKRFKYLSEGINDILLSSTQLLEEQIWSSNLYEHSDKFLVSPLYASKLLYWAAITRDVSDQDVEYILNHMEAYPEALVPLQSAIHAAAMVNDQEKLNMMCREYQARHITNQKKNEDEAFRMLQMKKNKCYCLKKKHKFEFIRKNTNVKYLSSQFDQLFVKLPELKQFKKSVVKFWAQLKPLNENDFTICILDHQKNTPLHLAAIRQANLTLESLVTEWGCKIGNKNLFGVMAKTMGAWWPNIYNQFKEYEDRYELELAKINKLHEQLSINENEAGVTQENLIEKLDNKIQSAIENMYQDLVQERKDLPLTPPIVIRMQALADDQKGNLNYILKTLIQNEFIVQIFKSVYENQYLLTVDLDQQSLQKEAIQIGYMMRHQATDIKIPFNSSSYKDRLYPFNSRDKQFLIKQKLRGLFNINDLIQDKLVLQVVNMHNPQEISFIQQNSGFFLGQHLPSFEQSWKNENGQNTINRFIAHENYFGLFETLKMAQKEHLTKYLLPPGLFALAISIHQIVDSNPISFVQWTMPYNLEAIVYAFLIAIWITLIFELWKRSESRLIQKLGYNPMNDSETSMNPDFKGYHHFSWSKFEESRNSNNTITDKGFLVLNFVVVLILVSVSIITYYLIKQYLHTAQYAGLLIAVISTFTGVMQKAIVPILMERSNIKYLKERNQYYIFFIMTFRLLNVNLPIIYAIFKPLQADNDDCSTPGCQYAAMYRLILSLIGVKCLSFIIMNYGWRLMTYLINRMKYSCKLSAQAKRQIKKHKACNLNQEEIRVLQNKAQKEIYKDFLPSLPKLEESQNPNKQSCCRSANKKEPLTLMKLAIKSETYKKMVVEDYESKHRKTEVEKNQILMDSIELNTCMPQQSEISQICDSTEKYVIFSVAVLYTGLCPLATVVVLCFFWLDQKLERWMNCYVMQRRDQNINLNLKEWNNFAESICVFAAFTNSYMLYYFSDYYKDRLKEVFPIHSDSVLYIVVVQEHVVLFILIFLRYIIKDTPKKIVKRAARMEKEVEQIHKMYSNPEAEKRIQELEQEIANLKHLNSTMTNQKKQTALEIIQEYNKQKEELSIRDGRLVDFLKVDYRQHEYEKLCNELDTALKCNLEQRLYRETFYLIERAILQRKLTKITNFSQIIQIACVQNCNNQATTFCNQCQDHYCDNCSTEIHKMDTNNYATHKQVKININPKNEIKSTNQNSLSVVQLKGTIWRKFEYFNFPLDPMNPEMYEQIQLHFENMKRVYVDLNHINHLKGTIDIACVFVDQNFESLERQMGREMMAAHIKSFGKQNIISQKEKLDIRTWNDEELFYLNRVAFRLFKKHFSQVRFDKFHSDLHTLQNGEFDLRLKLWLKLVCEMQEEIGEELLSIGYTISKQKLLDVITSSYPQDLNGNLTVDGVINKLFGQKSEMKLDEIMQSITAQSEVKALISCIIQV